jgi:hypothetical protein
MTGPKPHVRRDENRPIGNVPDTGRGAGTIAGDLVAQVRQLRKVAA